MRGRKKTDKVDAQGLAMLLRNGTLPEVWIDTLMQASDCPTG